MPAWAARWITTGNRCREQLLDRHAIGQIQPLKAETWAIVENIEPGLLQRQIIIAVKIIGADDAPPRFEQRYATWNPMKPAAPVTKIA